MKIVSFLVTALFCKELSSSSKLANSVNGNVPNPDIMTVLEKILSRMDRMEEKMRLSTDTVQRLESTVQGNSNILVQLDSHMKIQEKKTKELETMENRAEKIIKDNSKSIEDVAAKNQAFSRILKDTTAKINIEGQKIIQNTNDIAKITLNVKDLSEVVNNNLEKIGRDVTVIKNVLTKSPAGKTKSTPADSCSTLNEHNYKMKSGMYWVRKQGKVLFDYCRMDDAGVPPEPQTSLHVDILGVGHASNTTGMYFNFMRQSVPGLQLSRTLFFNATNPRTGMSGEVVVWGATNGGSTGDAHGRFNFKPIRPEQGQWTRGDILVLFI